MKPQWSGQAAYVIFISSDQGISRNFNSTADTIDQSWLLFKSPSRLEEIINHPEGRDKDRGRLSRRFNFEDVSPAAAFLIGLNQSKIWLVRAGQRVESRGRGRE